MNISNITLTAEQQQAVDLAVSNYKNRVLVTRLGGYAGTGKTTLIHAIRAALPDFVGVCAYTGKAACVLRNKGIPDASTIHSLIYKPHEEEHYDEKAKKTKTRVVFGRLPGELLDCKGFIIDEASMVSEELYRDLSSYRRPIIAVGDPGQLPPVSASDLNLMENPDLVLTEVHRQARESGIIRLATDIRLQGNQYALRGLKPMESDDVTIAAKFDVSKDEKADVFITGFNKTRVALNTKVRRRKGLDDGGTIAIGERIICLANNSNLGVFNGLMGVVQSFETGDDVTIEPRYEDPMMVKILKAKVLWDGETEPRDVNLSSMFFGKEKIDQNYVRAHSPLGLVCADYGYAITCHKSQGSQWDRCVVMNEGSPRLWAQQRWLYTAVTRAATSLAVGIDEA